MKDILIYSGTTEGRTLAQILAKSGFHCDVCVATEYGSLVMEESDNITIKQGRLDENQMRELFESKAYEAVIDATHPFATEVSGNIVNSLSALTNPPLYRLKRDVSLELDGIKTFENTDSCAKALAEAVEKTAGNILITTGSKELSYFCRNEKLKERLIVRVLPGLESINLCYENGLLGRQIIAMQGPFSEEINLAIIRQYNISVIVTKESGRIGGVDEKISAAKKAGIDCFLIRKPVTNLYKKEYTLEEICRIFSVNPKAFMKTTNLSVKKSETVKADDIVSNEPKSHNMEVSICGIGMGSTDYLTEAVKSKIENADVIFGAPRMIELVDRLNADCFMVDKALKSKQVYPYYLAKDIVPVIQKLFDDNNYDKGYPKVVVLMSGDTGFYSGTKKLCEKLQTLSNVSINVYPGVSSVSALAAKLCTSWNDAVIISTHGVLKEEWQARMLEAVKTNQNVFFIASGRSDINEIGGLLHGLSVSVYLGNHLSYEDEYVKTLSPAECEKFEDEGLFVGLIKNETAFSKRIVPGKSDEEFIRDKVPMTKEEVREISICKLALTENAVVYDVGSGTGSIAIEMAALSSTVKVYAIETNPAAVSLIRQNKEKFNLPNIEVVQALAPEGLEELKAPTHAFIGGSKGNLKQILDALYSKNQKMRVVINAVSLETISEANSILESYPIDNLDVAMVNISKAKKLGGYHLMQAANPVYIFSFDFREI